MFDWQDLVTAFALYLVLEGVIPFLNPAGFRRFVQSLAEFSDSTLRGIGLASMIAGAALLYFIRL